MKVRMTSSADPGWDEAARRLDAPLFHSTAWARYSMAGQANLVPVYCSLDDGAGIALFFRFASRNALLRPLSTGLYSDAHPWVRGNDPELLAAFLRSIEEQARRDGVVHLTIGSFGTPGHRAELESLGYTLKDRVEFFLRLDQTEEEMWQAMEYKRRKHLRNAIRKAEKMGVVIEELPAAEGAAHLRRLQQSTSRRIEARGGEVGFRLEEARASDPIALLVESGCGIIVGARHQDAVVSAGFFSHMNGMAYYTLAGHAPEAFECQAPTLLLWNTIQRFKAAGARCFNFGGTPYESRNPDHPEHGLYSYKEQFGGSVEVCTTGSKILMPMRYRLHQTAKEVLSR
jgi:CelD/BcsL family acetyltransferase involved in cellulose biosynthesis